MADMLIRDVPDAVVAAVDAHAVRLGLSRSEYVRRRLAQDAEVSGSSVDVSDATLPGTFSPLDPGSRPVLEPVITVSWPTCLGQLIAVVI